MPGSGKRNFPKRRKLMREKRFMNRQKHRKVIISGGGTGGHIYPAISIANALHRIDPSVEILFVGAEGRMEMEKVPAAGFRIIGLPVAGLNRNNFFKNFSVLVRLMKSLGKAKAIIRDFNPDVVVGVGGYASGPILRQAARRDIPTLIQEQNSYAGVTNKMLAKDASVICVAYDDMEKYFPAGKIIKTGNPVRQNFDNLSELKDDALRFFNLKPGFPVILILGGSLGAGSINKCLTDNYMKMVDSDCQWLWQTGKYYYDGIMKTASQRLSDNISIHPFIDRMELAFAAADIIVSRAGAVTISELCLVGKPVILVPSPNVAEDHQTKNARVLVKHNAAIMLEDNVAEKTLVLEAIKLMGNREKRDLFSENISKMAERDADLRIAEEVLKLAEK
jgi:UDP-N-acetylglucosamine--N-acetylmuramyl-(pentapeptide) pyrophosphoryl-undecaprenol N-acetylglucosamine transferase